MDPQLERTLPPADLDLVGVKHQVAPFWLEEIATLLRRGASDAEIVSGLRTTTVDYAGVIPAIPLDDEQCKALIADVRSLVAEQSPPL
jgi:hypothetical protein